MPALDELLDACRSAPDDDAPRLVWADAVGGERGELVVIQCDLARGDLPLAEAVARRRREDELLEAHGGEWGGLDHFECTYEIRRGFVEAIEIAGPTFVDRAEEIFACAPLLRSLTTTIITAESGDPVSELRALLDSPAFGRLDALCLNRIGTRPERDGYDPRLDGRGDAAARLLIESGALARLRGLGFSDCGLTSEGLRHLAASGALEHIEQLWLLEPHIDHEIAAVQALLARAPRLRTFVFGGRVSALAPIAAVLPPLTKLHLLEVDDEVLEMLGRSPAAATIESLGFTYGRLLSGRGFAAFPRLRDLSFRGVVYLSEQVLLDLAAVAPRLRRLRPPAMQPPREVMMQLLQQDLPEDPADPVQLAARVLGPRLEELELGTHAQFARRALAPTVENERILREQEADLDRIRAHVAGVVRCDPPKSAAPLL